MTYHTTSKKLVSQINTTTASLRTQTANIQLIMQGITYQVIGHGNDSTAVLLLNKLPPSLVKPAKNFLLDVLPLVEVDGTVKMKKGTQPDLVKAKEVADNLPDWQTYKKAKVEQVFDLDKIIAQMIKKLEKYQSSDECDEDDKIAIGAVLSYANNLMAHVPLEQAVADAMKAHETMRQAPEIITTKPVSNAPSEKAKKAA